MRFCLETSQDEENNPEEPDNKRLKATPVVLHESLCESKQDQVDNSCDDTVNDEINPTEEADGKPAVTDEAIKDEEKKSDDNMSQSKSQTTKSPASGKGTKCFEK